jgi:hypothetical protein
LKVQGPIYETEALPNVEFGSCSNKRTKGGWWRRADSLLAYMLYVVNGQVQA